MSNHAEVMARFAWRLIDEFEQVVVDLEPRLGPETGDLGIRIGLNSGSVTAGVLRGGYWVVGAQLDNNRLLTYDLQDLAPAFSSLGTTNEPAIVIAANVRFLSSSEIP